MLSDLHNHLVPGVDDGCVDLAESVDALRALYAEGVRRLVATPHLLLPRLRSDTAMTAELDLQRRAFGRLVEHIEGEPDLPAVGLGQEIWAPDAAALLRVVGRTDVGLAGSGMLLVEFGFDLSGTHQDVVRAAVDGGRGIIIAHPERYAYPPAVEPLEQMSRWREIGALLQVNAGSFTGHYTDHRPLSQALAWGMVSEGLVDLVATDHHGPRRTGVSPREAFDALCARGARELALYAMDERPGELLREAQLLEPSRAIRTRAAGG